jgi:hypothetical protein
MTIEIRLKPLMGKVDSLGLLKAEAAEVAREEEELKRELVEFAESVGLDTTNSIRIEGTCYAATVVRTLRSKTNWQAVVEGLLAENKTLLGAVSRLIEKHTDLGDGAVTTVRVTSL